MVRLLALDTNNLAAEGAPNDKEKGERIVSEPSISSAQRRRLADISNLQDQAKLINQGAKQQQQQNRLLSSKEYMEKLQKENMTLLKVLAERNKIIELSGIELQKLRINLQKVQEQNFQLAQANTQMLAELNTNKDRLRALQHELGCKNGLLRARKMQLEEQAIPKAHHTSENEVRANDLGKAGESFQVDDVDNRNTKRKQQSRTKSLGSSNIKSVLVNEKANKKRRVSGRKNSPKSEEVDNTNNCKETSQIEDNVDKQQFISDGANQIKGDVDDKIFVSDEASLIQGNIDNKRQRARRQSTRFESQEAEQTENLHEVDGAKETKDNERPSLRRRSARINSQALEPSENLHEIDEIKATTTSRRVSIRRQSTRFESHEPEWTENLNGIHDAQETTKDAGCCLRGQSIGTKSETLESAENLHVTHDTKETTGKQRTSTTRQPTKRKPQAAAAAADGTINDRSTEPSLRDDMVEDCNPLPPSDSQKDHEKEPKGMSGTIETEGMRRTSVGRPLRQAAGRIQSYKEFSLKVKMRRTE